MKKIILGIIVFIVVLVFAAKIPFANAAAGESNLLDKKDAAALATVLNALRGLLADIRLRLASPDEDALLDKVAVNVGLASIKINLISINGTLAALQGGPAIAESPAAAPQALVQQTEKQATAAESEMAQSAQNTPDSNVPTRGVAQTSPAPALYSETVPQTAQAAAGSNYRKFIWPTVLTVVAAAIVSLWLRRKKDEAAVEEISDASAANAAHPLDDSGLLFEPVEVPPESLFPSKIPDIPSSDLSPAVNLSSVLVPQSARPIVHPPEIRSRFSEEHDF